MSPAPNDVTICGTGVFKPPHVISNQELCASFNQYVADYNQEFAAQIASGEKVALAESSPEFIEKASGIKFRNVADKVGVLDPKRMVPNIPERPDDQMSLQCEFAVEAAKQALANAGRVGEEIDMVILATANLQRMYPSMAMEVQAAIGARGFAYDMSVACSSGTYAIQVACDAIRAGSSKCALVVNPEMMSGHINWRDRDSHFIFGDAATALVLEPAARAKKPQFAIKSTRLLSKFSSNIRNNAGFLNRCDPEKRDAPDKLFYQQGRKVFKDIIPLAAQFIASHVRSVELEPAQINRYWLHQANSNMNKLIAERLFGREATLQEAPTILDTWANTASCGSILALHHYKDDLRPGAWGVLCSFGAGYSIGSVLMQKL